MRKYGKVDANHWNIVQALRDLGCSVQSLASVGNGCPDLVVALRNCIWLCEVKDGSKPPSQRKLTADEQEWHERWKSEVHILYSVEDAVKMVTSAIPHPHRSQCPAESPC